MIVVELDIVGKRAKGREGGCLISLGGLSHRDLYDT